MDVHRIHVFLQGKLISMLNISTRNNYAVTDKHSPVATSAKDALIGNSDNLIGVNLPKKRGQCDRFFLGHQPPIVFALDLGAPEVFPLRIEDVERLLLGPRLQLRELGTILNRIPLEI